MKHSIFHFSFFTFHSPILRLALPSVVTNITVPLLGLVDTAVVGHMGRATYIGAIAIGTTIFNMLYWLFAFLRMGTTGIVSQAYGARATELVAQTLRRSLLWALGFAALLLVLQGPLLNFSLWLMKPNPEVAQYTSEYFRVCIWGAPAVLASYSLTGWFIGMQDTRTPMWMAIVQNLSNILFTLFFVFVLGLGVRGVALGTVVGCYTGLLTAASRPTPLAPSLLRRGIGYAALNEKLKIKNEKLIDVASLLPSLGGVGGGLFLRTLCLIAVTVYFTTAGSRLGSLYLDANALLMQFFIVFSYFTDGLANAAEALTGEQAGRGDRAGLLRVVRSLFRWGGGLALLFTVLYATCGQFFLSLLTDQAAVLHTAHAYLPWVVAVPFASFCAFVWDGVFIGMTRTWHMFLSMLVSALVFFALWFLLGPRWGNHALWLSFLAYLATRSLVQTVMFRRWQ